MLIRPTTGLSASPVLCERSPTAASPTPLLYERAAASYHDSAERSTWNWVQSSHGSIDDIDQCADTVSCKSLLLYCLVILQNALFLSLSLGMLAFDSSIAWARYGDSSQFSCLTPRCSRRHCPCTAFDDLDGNKLFEPIVDVVSTDLNGCYDASLLFFCSSVYHLLINERSGYPSRAHSHPSTSLPLFPASNTSSPSPHWYRGRR